jgi:orsellinic acid C2-O-methyltransferase
MCEPEADWSLLIENRSFKSAVSASFQAAMSEGTAAFAPSLAATYDFPRMRHIVDVGGGRGTLLVAVLAARPDLRGALFDLPEIAAGSSGLLRAAGVADRCVTSGGDFFATVPADHRRAGADDG